MPVLLPTSSAVFLLPVIPQSGLDGVQLEKTRDRDPLTTAETVDDLSMATPRARPYPIRTHLLPWRKTLRLAVKVDTKSFMASASEISVTHLHTGRLCTI